MGVETQIPDGEGICLVTVGLDAEAAEQARQAALQAHVGIAATLSTYAETLLNVQLKKSLGSSGALACLIDFDGNKDLAVQMASGVLALAANHATLIALSAEESPDLILYAMRAGCTEYLTKPLQGQQLAELLRKLRERWLSTARRSIQTNGRVLAFIGVRGGAGATTIAVHLAASWPVGKGRKR